MSQNTILIEERRNDGSPRSARMLQNSLGYRGLMDFGRDRHTSLPLCPMEVSPTNG